MKNEKENMQSGDRNGQIDKRHLARQIPQYDLNLYRNADFTKMMYDILNNMDYERFYRDRISLWECCGDYGKGECPFCETRSFCADLRTGRARCPKCFWRGDPVSFIQRHHKVALHVAIVMVYTAKGVAL